MSLEKSSSVPGPSSSTYNLAILVEFSPRAIAFGIDELLKNATGGAGSISEESESESESASGESSESSESDNANRTLFEPRELAELASRIALLIELRRLGGTAASVVDGDASSVDAVDSVLDEGAGSRSSGGVGKGVGVTGLVSRSLEDGFGNFRAGACSCRIHCTGRAMLVGGGATFL